MTPTPELTIMKSCLEAADLIYRGLIDAKHGFILEMNVYEQAMTIICGETFRPPAETRDEIFQLIVDYKAKYVHTSCCTWNLAHDLHHLLVLRDNDDTVN